MSLQTKAVFEFGWFHLNPAERRLLRGKVPVQLPPKAFDALLVMVESRGRLLGKDELMRKVWPDSFVEESNLAQHVSILRRALRDGEEGFQYIETVPRYGYRFVAQVRELGGIASDAGAWSDSTPSQLSPAVPESGVPESAGPRHRFSVEMRPELLGLKRDSESGDCSPASSSMVALAEATAAGVAKLWKIVVPVLLVALLVAGGLYYRALQSTRLTEKDTIVIADFTNNTGDAIFDDTLKTALNVSLRQSPFLNVLSDGDAAKTLQLMARPAGTKITPEIARELCQRAGSKAYIAGTVGSLGREYVLGLKAVNCQSGDTLAEEQVTVASKEKVLDALGEAASKLRGELGESLATVQKLDVPLEQATTSSLEALQALSLGEKARSEKGLAAALPYHQRAIQLDPNFAIGYNALGNDYNSLGETGRAREYYTKAFQLREHASEREKLSIAAAYYQNVTGELDK